MQQGSCATPGNVVHRCLITRSIGNRLKKVVRRTSASPITFTSCVLAAFQPARKSNPLRGNPQRGLRMGPLQYTRSRALSPRATDETTSAVPDDSIPSWPKEVSHGRAHEAITMHGCRMPQEAPAGGAVPEATSREMAPRLRQDRGYAMLLWSLGTLAALGALADTAMAADTATPLAISGGPSEWIKSLEVVIASAGPEGYLYYTLAYVLAAVLFVPGSILTVAAGFLFGPLAGTAVVSVASTLAAATAFLIARYLARPQVLKRLEGNRSGRFNMICVIFRALLAVFLNFPRLPLAAGSTRSTLPLAARAPRSCSFSACRPCYPSPSPTTCTG
eukprot:jgi/Mesvir1/14756/Mv05398-RA.1